MLFGFNIVVRNMMDDVFISNCMILNIVLFYFGILVNCIVLSIFGVVEVIILVYDFILLR